MSTNRTRFWQQLGLIACISNCAAQPAHAAETQKYRYDAKGRLTKVERTGSVNAGKTTEYSHDKADNRTRVTTTP
jgi:coenzyme F420-reducing hydrogenase delta subunit